MASFGPSPETRQTLLIRLRDLKDVEAWGTFYEVYLPMIQRYCRSVGLQEADAADIIVFGGGIIPAEDLDELSALGVTGIFTPGAPTADIVAWLRDAVATRRAAQG